MDSIGFNEFIDSTSITQKINLNLAKKVYDYSKYRRKVYIIHAKANRDPWCDNIHNIVDKNPEDVHIYSSHHTKMVEERILDENELLVRKIYDSSYYCNENIIIRLKNIKAKRKYKMIESKRDKMIEKRKKYRRKENSLDRLLENLTKFNNPDYDKTIREINRILGT